MRKPGRLRILWALVLVAALVPWTAASALTRDEYSMFYQVSDLLCEDWDTDWDTLLWDIAPGFGYTAGEMEAFLHMAVLSDGDHVWIPVNGGQKYHATHSCSNMIEPRPTTKDQAKDFGFTPCKRCKPGL